MKKDSCLSRILVVDDEPEILRPIIKGLELRKFHVDGFTNPLDALGVYQSGKYDLAILDIAMPGMTGFQLAHQLMTRDPLIKIGFLSAWSSLEEDFERQFPFLPKDNFLLKPISTKELSDFIRKSLQINWIDHLNLDLSDIELSR